MAKALEGIKVLEFGRFVAVPFCTLLFVNLGAEVIKTEIPGSGDATRTAPPLTEGGEAYLFMALNRGKKSITLNLNSERGVEIVKELVKGVDIVVENLRCGTMDSLGLGYEGLSKINPKLIYASISGFGHTGPDSSQIAFDPTAQARGGLMSVTGFPGGPPTRTGPSIADYIAGLHTAFAILAALRYRDKAGKGQFIDISMQDCIWSTVVPECGGAYFLNGRIPQRLGNALPTGVPYNSYYTKDGMVFIMVGNEAHWQSLLEVMGKEDLGDVPEYSTSIGRVNHRDELDLLVQEWTRPKTTKEIVSELTDAHVPCSPIPSFDEVPNDPQLLSREMVIEVEQLISGRVKVPGSVFKLSETPGDVKFPAPFLGEHNYEVYSSMLGYSEEEIGVLTDEGII